MATTTHIHLRAARDRLLDLLEIGQTYPLRDLAVRDEQLTVAFNTTAKIPIDDSQSDVLYCLHFNQSPVERTPAGEEGTGVPIEAQGNGGRILLETYKIQDDITFDIYAVKQRSGRAAYLHQTATVKVGLDTSLKAWIRDMPHLDPALQDLTDAAPRLVNYGATVEVEIQNSQEGVDYRLVHFTGGEDGQDAEEVVLSVDEAQGDLHNIILRTESVYEDIDIRIRATKTFDPSENRETQTALLDAILPLKVRANPALPVSIEPAPIIDFEQPATISLANTQASASYQLYLRPIPDRDFIHSETPAPDALTVPVEGEPAVQVRQPDWNEIWTTPEGYTAWGEAQPGTGGDLEFTVDGLTDDSLIIVRAEKVHQAGPDSEPAQTIPSAVQLAQAMMVLTRPNSAPPLRLNVLVEATETSGDLQVFDGQPGVFYEFRLDPDQAALGLPAYFHQRDDRDERVNKGTGQLTIGVDYVIARPLPPSTEAVSLAEIGPQPPLLETGPLPVDTDLHIRAVKAQTRVATALAQTVRITSLPDIHLQDEIVDYGGSTRILVAASVDGDKYQPLLAGNSLRRARNGNGEELSFNTDAITADTEFEMLITRPNDVGIAVERLVKLQAAVRPKTDLPVSPTEALVDYNGAIKIQLEGSQSGVSYQLLVNENPAGEPVPGNDSTLLFPSGPLGEDSILVVQAAKITNPDIAVTLAQQVAVTVRPNPALPVSPANAVVDHNSGIDIQVEGSQTGVSYQLLGNGTSVGEAVVGTGDTIALPSGALTEDTNFVVRATRADNADIAVDLAQQIEVLVRPDVTLSVSSSAEIVDPDGATDIQIEGSQPGVSYQLLAADAPVGDPVVGTGDTIAIPTGPLTENTTFVIQATKLANPDISVALTQEVTVQVRVESEGE